ncbi:MAG: beta-N-acetylhexosaminidase [Thermoleophilaceae bacterium]|nr:beta-N-acetylhexosaminidase [Thermoleophilaceae bacterium]
MREPSRSLVALVAVVALASAVAGAVLGARESDEQRAALPERAGRPLERSSFLARIVPARPRPQHVNGPATPRSVEDLVRRLPLERKVAQLFLFGFEGTDASAEIFRRLGRLDLGGLVLARENYLDPAQLSALAGEVRRVAADKGHVLPWVLASQDGAEFSDLPGLPPATAPADLESAGAAAAEATETATTLRDLNVTGVLGPTLDVGSASGSPLGARVYSDDPDEVAGYADAVVHSYRNGRLFAAAKHFPGLGAADQLTQIGPATVGLDLAQLRERDLIPFEAAIDAGVPAVMLSHALYPMNDFTQPASLTRSIATDLLRKELGFAGVAIADDLADPAISSSYSVPDAAVKAVRAGVDMVIVSGSAGDQQAAYSAVLRAAQSGELARARLNEAVRRVLEAKRDYGLIR